MLMTATASSANAGYSIGTGFECKVSPCPATADFALSGWAARADLLLVAVREKVSANDRLLLLEAEADRSEP